MSENLQNVTSLTSTGIATSGLNPDKTALLDSVPVDNSNLLIQRYDKWIGLLNSLSVFVEEYLGLIKSGGRHYEKINKFLINTMIPQFDVEYSTGTSSQSASLPNAEVASPTPNTAVKPTETGPVFTVDGINQWFDSIKYNMDLNWKKFQEIEQSIKVNISPEFKRTIDEINQKKKYLTTEQLKEIKELRKLNSISAKEVGKLTNATQVYTTSTAATYKIDYKNDPYFCNRSVLYNADIQIQKENLYIDFLTNNEQSFEIYEKQLVDIVKKIFNNLNNLNMDLAKQQQQSFQLLNDQIISIPNDAEWKKFADLNSKQLIQGNPYKRSLQGVTFPNEDHVSIEPILEGLLARKEGKLKKNYSTYYYVITKTRYLYEFQSRSFKDSPTPSLIFYLPHSFIGKPSGPQDQKFKFVLTGKDHTNLVNITKKTITLRLSNYEEMMTWYNVLSEVSGQMIENEESRLELMTLDDSFDSPSSESPVDPRVN